MGLNIFRKLYTVRRHGTQAAKRGYSSAPYTDIVMRLNVQPQAPDSFESKEEGDVTEKRLKAWGKDRLISADPSTDTPGDCLYYQGEWYECISSVMWGHTAVAHYQSDFTLMPADRQFGPPGSKTPPLKSSEVGS